MFIVLIIYMGNSTEHFEGETFLTKQCKKCVIFWSHFYYVIATFAHPEFFTLQATFNMNYIKLSLREVRYPVIVTSDGGKMQDIFELLKEGISLSQLTSTR
jgi:hypothetical protein